MRDNRAAAADLVSRVETVVAKIAESPHLGHATHDPRFHLMPLGSYLIVCEINPTEVIVQYVRHGARQRRGRIDPGRQQLRRLALLSRLHSLL